MEQTEVRPRINFGPQAGDPGGCGSVYNLLLLEVVATINPTSGTLPRRSRAHPCNVLAHSDAL